MKSSLDLVQRCLISSSFNVTFLPGFLPRTSRSLLIIASTFSSLVCISINLTFNINQSNTVFVMSQVEEKASPIPLLVMIDEEF